MKTHSKEKFSIFCAGYLGKCALVDYGKDRINCFIDNNIDLHGTYMDGIPVISLKKYMEEKFEDIVLIANVKDFHAITLQLKMNGMENFIPYYPSKHSYYPEDSLIYNKYSFENEAKTEEAWNENVLGLENKEYIRESVNALMDNLPLFNHIEIETYNRCNGICEFCPVNIKNDIRDERKMTWSLFTKIVDELHALQYRGRIALFSNNEPFLDDRIIEFHKYARNKLPDARFHLFSNGTLITLEKYIEIIDYLDELIIDNYNQNLNLITTVKAIKKYCEEHTELVKKTTIVLRKPKEILTTRGGDSPNRKFHVAFESEPCMLPFKEIIVRPDGKVSLCCNDPYGRNTFGDVSVDSLRDVWFGEKFQAARKAIYNGRGKWSHCKNCDTFLVV